MSSTDTNWSAYVFPPLFVAGAVIIKDALVDGYSLRDQILITDIGINIVLYLLSDVIVQFGLNRMFVQQDDYGKELLESGTDIILQPAIHGLICGVIRPMIHSDRTLTHPITFMYPLLMEQYPLTCQRKVSILGGFPPILFKAAVDNEDIIHTP